MDKVCVLGDIHIAVRNSSLVFHKQLDLFANDVLIPYLKENNIDTVFQLGDLFDTRKSINFLSLYEARKCFFDKLKENNIKLHTLVGNHDIYFRETLEVNSSSLLLKEYDNITVYDKPTTIDFNGISIDIIPWICAENRAVVNKMIQESSSKLCIGHFEFANFPMYKGVESHGGIVLDDFYKKYDLILTGHFHTQSNNGNVHYTGIPYEMTWSDYNDQKGFHVLDIKTLNREFIPNPHKVFARIEYDDSNTDYTKESTSQYSGKYVKVIVINKKDLYAYDTFMKRLYSAGCNDIKVMEDLSEYQDGIIDEKIDLTDTRVIMSNYVDSIESKCDKQKIKNLLSGLFNEAINVSDKG
jgi:DNA repair exonuclease SbcCD nuclease subunit